MLTQLSIQNFTLIENMTLNLNAGMTVISGETGAGKSIMLDALGLALGDRADSDMIRHGCERADIRAQFDISQLQNVQTWLQEQDLDQDGECLLRRVINSNGRSRAYINGHLTPLQNLRTLGEQLIDIHGQHEHQKLLKKGFHQQLLDEFGQHSQQTQELADTFNNWKNLNTQLNNILQQSDDQHAEVQLLSYQLQELEQLDPQSGELEELEREHKTLANADTILSQGERVRQLTSESDEANCQSLLHQSLQQLDKLGLDDPTLNSVSDMLNSALIQVQEAASELDHYLSRVEADPERLAWLDERMSSLYQVARKHHSEPEKLPEIREQISQRLAQIDVSDEHIEALKQQADEALNTYTAAATELSKQRQQAAANLGTAINQQLAQLGMPDCRFEAQINEKQPSATGIDDIEFLVATNPGQPAKPLHKVASGGELSRISLAIQVVTAQTSATPVMAFDEVDVGIGGAIAEVVGQLLRDLGKQAQVLCVTHQPQVASKGHQHLHVSKGTSTDQSNGAEQKHSQINVLQPEQRINEIARMLGGIDITQRSLDHAAEMLALH